MKESTRSYFALWLEAQDRKTEAARQAAEDQGHYHRYEHGTAYITHFGISESGRPYRYEDYRRHDEPERPIFEMAAAASMDDYSPRHDTHRHYHADCTFCWLGHTHTEAAHVKDIR